jgi:Stress responsive A/B Barrel Domain
MPQAIGSIRAYEFGPDAGVNPANRDYAVVADFDDQAGYLAYRDHPAHRELVERYVNPIVAERAAVQFEI